MSQGLITPGGFSSSLLWKNNNPSEKFYTQKIIIPGIKLYKWILIGIVSTNTQWGNFQNTSPIFDILSTDNSGYFAVRASNAFFCRNFTIESDGITAGVGYRLEQYLGNTEKLSENNSCCVPIEIYGIL